MASESLVEASLLLSSLRIGEPVVITVDQRDIEVTVQSGLRRDPGDVGDPHHARLTVGYGPGRWNAEVSAARIADGYVTLRRAPVEEPPC